MKFKDKEGKEISWNEFKNRFRRGVEGITPLQQTKNQFIGTFLIFIGLVWGIIFSYNNEMFWLSLILIGALIVQLFAFIGMYQKYILLKRTDALMKVMKGGEENNEQKSPV